MNDKNIIRARSKNGFFEKNNFLKNYYANFGAVESCAENSGTFVRSTLREREGNIQWGSDAQWGLE